MKKYDLKDIFVVKRVSYKECKFFPSPLDRYAFNLAKWAKFAQKEDPPGKCVMICACIQSLLTGDPGYIHSVTEIISTDSQEAEALILGLSGMVLSHIGYKPQGLELLRYAVKLWRSDRMLLSLAAELDDDENICESIDLCNSVLRRYPSNAEALRLLSVNLLNQGSIEEAETKILHAMEADPRSRLIRQVYGDVLYAKGEYSRAIKKYRRARAFCEYKPYVFYRLACCFHRIEKQRLSRKFARKLDATLFRVDPFFRQNRSEIEHMISEITSM